MGVRFLARFFVASVLTLLTLVALFGELSAWGQNAKGSPTLVLIVEGGAGPKLATAILTELSSWTRADAKAVAAAAKKRELAASLEELHSPVSKGPYLLRLGRVASDVGAAAAVAVEVSKGKPRQAHVVLVSAAGGTKLDVDVTLGAPADDATTIARALSIPLGTLGPQEAPPSKLDDAGAPPPASDASAEAPKPAEAAAEDAGPTPPRAAPEKVGEEPPLVVGTVAIQLANRHLNYRDAVTSLPADDSGLAPTPSVAIEVFPGSRTGTVFLQDIGVFGDFDLGIVHGKTLPGGSKASASWTRFDVGLKYRIWLWGRDWKKPMIAPSVSYGQESYSYDDSAPSPTPLETPSVAYKMIRPRLDLRVPVGPIALLGGGGYLAVVKSGEVSSKFRDPRVIGWEADLAATLPLGTLFEARAGVGYRRYIYWFSPQEGDTNIANGAHDQVLRIELGASAHF
jgi:hypothetical protein